MSRKMGRGMLPEDPHVRAAFVAALPTPPVSFVLYFVRVLTLSGIGAAAMWWVVSHVFSLKGYGGAIWKTAGLESAHVLLIKLLAQLTICWFAVYWASQWPSRQITVSAVKLASSMCLMAALWYRDSSTAVRLAGLVFLGTCASYMFRVWDQDQVQNLDRHTGLVTVSRRQTIMTYASWIIFASAVTALAVSSVPILGVLSSLGSMARTGPKVVHAWFQAPTASRTGPEFQVHLKQFSYNLVSIYNHVRKGQAGQAEESLYWKGQADGFAEILANAHYCAHRHWLGHVDTTRASLSDMYAAIGRYEDCTFLRNDDTAMKYGLSQAWLDVMNDAIASVIRVWVYLQYHRRTINSPGAESSAADQEAAARLQKELEELAERFNRLAPDNSNLLGSWTRSFG
ncbi:hypothetical protein FVE85_4106 [Porphyridium purpureum]|uniref:Uncharacterized protein n=1 Tax=Porphyridium purpureum TaxID=35688 RepID=A0A5J4YRL7_PORPP|nr:hypothetical protein FVE85_4106 [Porphyridium purpureum]|eukprot:POR7330..scf229_5